ncbi:MAG: 2-oxoacid:acceptor oxidoreductase family protein [Peptostreptococcaceae bacterium]|nr:2-oxoacid:acceptor oxidoreductase family protein [Peptostreptococcaceae bacterium]
MKTEIRLSGSGGQGVILIGVVIAEAGIDLGKNAIQSQSYGPEARGGASKAEVVISDEEIYFTKVLKPNVFLALTQDSYDKYNKEVIDGGICIVDHMVKTGDEAKNRTIYSLPIIDTAMDVLGKTMVTNIVALGALSQVLEGLTEDALKTAMLHRIPKGTEELNLQAFAEGVKLMEQYKK